MSLINQYSFLWIAAVLVTIAALFLLRKPPKRQRYLFASLMLAIVVGAWLVLHPIQTPRMDTAAQVQAQIGQGTPVLLEFQSPY